RSPSPAGRFEGEPLVRVRDQVCLPVVDQAGSDSEGAHVGKWPRTHAETTMTQLGRGSVRLFFVISVFCSFRFVRQALVAGYPHIHSPKVELPEMPAPLFRRQESSS